MKKATLFLYAVYMSLTFVAGGLFAQTDTRLQGAWAAIQDENYKRVFIGDNMYEIYGNDEIMRCKFSTNSDKTTLVLSEAYHFRSQNINGIASYSSQYSNPTEFKPYIAYFQGITGSYMYRINKDKDNKDVFIIDLVEFKKINTPAALIKELDRKFEINKKTPNLDWYDVLNGQIYAKSTSLNELTTFKNTGDFKSFKLSENIWKDKKMIKDDVFYGRLVDACADAVGWENQSFILKPNSEITFYQNRELSYWDELEGKSTVPPKSEQLQAIYSGTEIPFYNMRKDADNNDLVIYYKAYVKDGKPTIEAVKIIKWRDELKK